MSEEELVEFNEIYSELENYFGLDPRLDTKIQSVRSNYEKRIQYIKKNPSEIRSQINVMTRVKYLIEQWKEYRNDTTYSKARQFFQNVCDEIVTPSPTEAEPLALLSVDDHMLIFPTEKGSDYILECSYLEHKSLSGCYSIAHEIGHCFFQEYISSPEKLREIIALILKPVYKLCKKISIPLNFELFRFWISRWVSEFTADAISVVKMGAGVVLSKIEFAKRTKTPLHLGSDSHPPGNLRIEFMKNRLLTITRRRTYSSEALEKIEKWSPKMRNEMTTANFLRSAINDPLYDRDAMHRLAESDSIVTIPNKLAFDNKILRAIRAASDVVLEWSNTADNFSQVEEAERYLLDSRRPDAGPSTLFAALLNITSGKENEELENLILQ